MPISIITSKGQTTIPKAVRDSLHLKPKDKLLYTLEGDRVIVQPVHHEITHLRGIFRHVARRPIDFQRLRKDTKRMVGRRFTSRPS